MELLNAPLSRLGFTLGIALIILITSQNVECTRRGLLGVEVEVEVETPGHSRLNPSNDRPYPPSKSSSPSNDRPNPPPKSSPSNDPSIPPTSSSPPMPIDDTFYPVPSIDSPPITPSPEAYPPLLPPLIAPSPSPIALPPLAPPQIDEEPSIPTVDSPPQVPSHESIPPPSFEEEPSNPTLSPPSPNNVSPPSPPSDKPSPSDHRARRPPSSHHGHGKRSPPSSDDEDTTPKLEVGFYQGKCSNKSLDVEELIASIVEEHFLNDHSLLPALLRLQFHDCFVHGCDASLLIEGNTTEKTAPPNLTVRGYELIDTIKESIEEECPGIVSCSDIMAVATNAILKLGGGPEYLVETGRRDGMVSKAEDVDLPSPTLTVPETIAVFQAKNFTAEEMVVLLGCHTVGVAHCPTFEDRLYSGTSQFDPNMDPALRDELSQICPQGQFSNNATLLNQNPKYSGNVDNTFYNQILEKRGILSIDQALAFDSLTEETVQQLSQNATLFNVALANAMVKLQAVDVLTGDQGEIRNVCSKFN